MNDLKNIEYIDDVNSSMEELTNNTTNNIKVNNNDRINSFLEFEQDAKIAAAAATAKRGQYKQSHVVINEQQNVQHPPSYYIRTYEIITEYWRRILIKQYNLFKDLRSSERGT